jgi:hypothetical protein
MLTFIEIRQGRNLGIMSWGVRSKKNGTQEDKKRVTEREREKGNTVRRNTDRRRES